MYNYEKNKEGVVEGRGREEGRKNRTVIRKKVKEVYNCKKRARKERRR